MIRRNHFAHDAARDSARAWPRDVRIMNATAVLLTGAVLVAGLITLGNWLIRQPVFNVQAIRIEGDVNRNSIATIRANALPYVAGNYFTLDMLDSQRAFQAVPWVRRAVVSRLWPNRLNVKLEEHRAAALWETEEGGEQLVNTFGEVFLANVGDVEDEGLPKLQGPVGSSATVLSAYRRLTPMFEQLGMRIELLSLSGRGSWQARFNDGAEIELGRGSEQELAERTERFAGTVSQVLARYQRPVLFADLRHNGGYALRLKGITTTATVAPAAPARN